MTRAFDQINSDVLISKLQNYNFLCSTIHSVMLISTMRLMTRGRLVTVLGKQVFCPQYFLICFHWYQKGTLDIKSGYELVRKSYSIIAFADDITFLAPCRTGLQHLTEVHWSSFWIKWFLIGENTISWRDAYWNIINQWECWANDPKNFLKQLNFWIYESINVDRKVLTYLFPTYTRLFYGPENWILTGCKKNPKVVLCVS